MVDESISEIDEALSNLAKDLKRDEYGNRMDWRKKNSLEKSIDSLLDARSKLTEKNKQATKD